MDPMLQMCSKHPRQVESSLREVDSPQISKLRLLDQIHRVRTIVGHLGVIVDLIPSHGVLYRHLDTVC